MMSETSQSEIAALQDAAKSLIVSAGKQHRREPAVRTRVRVRSGS